MSGVLVTGASTPLGRALVCALADDARVSAVLAVAREARWDGAHFPKLTYVPADLTRSRELRRLLFGPARELEVRAVVHAALPRSPLEGGHALTVETTRELLYLCERHASIRRLVYRSFAEIYRIRPEGGGIIGEAHPLDLSRGMPSGVRDRVEADLTVCTRMGMAPTLSIAVLRFAELLAPSVGSQLCDYLGSRVCFRPLGFDPMMHVLSIEDAVAALVSAVFSDAQGVFNVPGADVLPLSRVVALAGRRGIAVPGPLLGPLYAARGIVRGTEFRYPLNRWRFHFSGVLDGRRAERELGYHPSRAIDWTELARELDGDVQRRILARLNRL
jgi:UDP-glucose 4-epimerase